MPGDRWQKLANLRALYAYMWAHPGKKLLFMGCEFAQEREWSHERSLDWHLLENPEHAGIQSLVRDLNRVYRDAPGAVGGRRLRPTASTGSSPTTPTNNVVAFCRVGAGPGDATSSLSCATSRRCRARATALGLPQAGPLARGAQHRRRASTAAANVGNLGGVEAEADRLAAASRSRPS